MFKKITSSPKLFLSLAGLSLVIVFSAGFWFQTQMAGAKAAYWQFKLKKLLVNQSIEQPTNDPLITQANLSDKQPTQPTIKANDSKKGNAQAKVTIFEFSDFTCPACANVQPILKQVETAYKNQIQIIWLDFPLTTAHVEALKSARAGQCSRLQTKPGDQFWAYHDLLFANQDKLNYDNYLVWAKQLGLDQDIFANCLAKNQDVNAKILEDIDQGNSLGVSGTPTFYVNGQVISGQATFDDFKKIIDAILVE